MNWYFRALKKYAVFSGRASRKEFWMFYLFHSIFTLLAVILDSIFKTNFYNASYGLITTIYAIIVLLPSIAVAVRRLHDAGMPGGWYFISFVPCIGGIWFLILMCEGGDVCANQYGINPKTQIFD